MGILFFDTETTGLNPGQICQLSYILEENNQVSSGNYFFRVDDMPKSASDVHGFTKEILDELSDGMTFKDKCSELLNIFSNKTLVAHNLPFDEKFMSSEFWRCGISFKPSGRVDSMEFFKNILKIPAKSRRYGPYKNPKLSEVADFYGVNSDKVREYCVRLFSSPDVTFHDSRFDTAMMYVLTNIHREKSSGGRDWTNYFC